MRVALILPDRQILFRNMLFGIMNRFVGNEGQLVVGAVNPDFWKKIHGDISVFPLEDLDNEGPFDLRITIRPMIGRPVAQVAEDDAIDLFIDDSFPDETGLFSALVPTLAKANEVVLTTVRRILRLESREFLTCAYADSSWLENEALNDTLCDVAAWLASQELVGLIVGVDDGKVDAFRRVVRDFQVGEISELLQTFEVRGGVLLSGEIPFDQRPAAFGKRLFKLSPDGEILPFGFEKRPNHSKNSSRVQTYGMNQFQASTEQEMAAAAAEKLSGGETIIWFREIERALNMRFGCSKILSGPAATETRIIEMLQKAPVHGFHGIELYGGSAVLNDLFEVEPNHPTQSPFATQLAACRLKDEAAQHRSLVDILPPETPVHFITELSQPFLLELTKCSHENHNMPFFLGTGFDQLGAPFHHDHQAALTAFTWGEWNHIIFGNLMISLDDQL